MKIYRLLEMIIYLLNHEIVTAKQLAEKFEVSTRTIQRDMDSLLIAGIPIVTTTGIYGGYAIASDYKLANQFVKKEDFNLIIRALKSFTTGYDNKELDVILQKYLALSSSSSQHIYFDYSVTKEDQAVQDKNKIIEESILSHYQITFKYRNINNIHSDKNVIPIVLRFQWYAWYLFAYDVTKEDYRTYKVARIQDLQMTNISFAPQDSKSIEKSLKENDQEYLATCKEITVWCHKDSLLVAQEYFPIETVEITDDNHYILHFFVPIQERLWQALLIRMGDDIKIIEPEYYRDELIRIAQNFLSNYDKQLS